MEPNLLPDMVGTDVTRYFLQDLGYAICGDGELTGAEECDDGNIAPLDGCAPSCEIEVCGDGGRARRARRDDGAARRLTPRRELLRRLRFERTA
jgi:cysteine-rich repeat protein